MKSAIWLLPILLAACDRAPEPTQIEHLDLAKIDGVEARCARTAADSALNAVEMTKLLSVSGATETLGSVSDAIAVEIERCVLDVYLMGIEEGRRLEREVY